MPENIDIEDLFYQADMARAYAVITEEMGPSEQLLAFINFDGKLGEEIGLEGFDSLSLNSRHEIVKLKLNPDAFDQIAMEALAEKIDKISKWMMVLGTATAAGSFGFALKQGPAKDAPVASIVGAIGGLVTAYSGVIVKIANDAINGVISSENFELLKRAADSSLDYEIFTAKSIPNTFTQEAWQKYHDLMWKKGSTGFNKYSLAFDDAWESGIKETKTVGAYKTWDVENFKVAIKWLDESTKNLNSLSKQYAGHLDSVVKWIKDNKDNSEPSVKATMKLINKSLNATSEAFEGYTYMIERGTKAIKRVSKLFEKK
jgi:hypothetical protein